MSEQTNNLNDHTVAVTLQQNIVPHNFFGKFLQIQDEKIQAINDRMFINLSALCTIGNKRFKDWYKYNTEYVKYVMKDLGVNNENDIIYQSYTCGKNKRKVWWGNFWIAIAVAQYVNIEFRHAVTKWVAELGLFGNVTLGEERSIEEMQNKYNEAAQKLIDEQKKRVEAEKKYDQEKDDRLAVLGHLDYERKRKMEIYRENEQLQENIVQLQDDYRVSTKQINMYKYQKEEAEATAREVQQMHVRAHSEMPIIMKQYLMINELKKHFMKPVYIAKYDHMTDIIGDNFEYDDVRDITDADIDIEDDEKIEDDTTDDVFIEKKTPDIEDDSDHEDRNC